MLRLLLVLAAALMFVRPAAAEEARPSWNEWLQALRHEAIERGISQKTVDAALTGLTPLERVVKADRKQPEFAETLDDYLAKRVSPARVENGHKFLTEYADVLAKVAAVYHVQPRYIVAIWGMETNYGLYKVKEDAIQALATLAYDPRRGSYFRRELFAALKIVDAGYIDLKDMKSSWAGAMGQSQFMPTSYLAYAVDFDGDGHRDIWNSYPDIFASIANYLAKHGWSGDRPWGEPVTLPANFEGKLAKLGTYDGAGCRATREHSVALPVHEWQALGVRLKNGGNLPLPNLSASVLRIDGYSDQAFLVFTNFRAILGYNCANSYAVAVGKLAEAIQ